MDVIKIIGGKPLKGKIRISGSKNAALPIMAASLLTSDTMVLSNMPNLSDMVTMNQLLMNHGVDFSIDGSNITENKTGRTILFNASNITNLTAPYDIVRKMRASFLTLGPILARYGRMNISLPGGCAIGHRPVDLHLYAMKQLGAKVTLEDGYIKAEAPNGLKGGHIHFDIISVGATENALMAATLADGETLITNAAVEPEIIDLTNCLITMGAKIEGIGTSTLKIIGSSKLHGGHHTIIPDRIEAGSYAVAAAVTDGELELVDIDYSSFDNMIGKFEQAGVIITKTKNGVKVHRSGTDIKSVNISTSAYPGFSTDMQAQFMMMMSIADKVSVIAENVWENRFMHVSELSRMGANITINGRNATVRGTKILNSANVMASDLRASISLILAGLVAKGETYVHRVYHLDRGYESVEQKLFACGAEIYRINNG
ncbi:MAG: UDP-N-acetylglucosamine 1-carboxyvinyltransferase [Rickettsiales bacterium]|jgi:UDP-N-acetylglucosamine 1-carboxyvinyltransferase|nr:UDP-N-acetylglucosamine 1-carboxyvinyltransferase [Rickettsiales bacterium]